MNVGLIDNRGKIIEGPYYEIENLCKKIIDEYCSLSEENQKNFNEFAKDYTYFSPYFDFVVGTLGYGLINPFWVQKTILYGNKEKRCFQRKGYSKVLEDYVALDYNKEYFHFSSDKDLKIKPFTLENRAYTSFITPNLLELTPVCNFQELSRQILNLGMIKSQKLCEELESTNQIMNLAMENQEEEEILGYYFPLLKLEYKEISFRSDNISMKQEEIISYVKDERPDIYIVEQKNCTLYKPKNWSHKFINDENIIYLNKR